MRPRRAAVFAALGSALPKGALVLSILTFAGYAMGLVRARMFAHAFGAGADLDAYNAAFVLPELALDVLVAGGLVAPFVPLFIGLRAEAASAARDFGRTILTSVVIVMAIVAAILFVLAPQTASIIAPGFVGEQRDLYVSLFRVMCVTPVIFGASMVLGEVLVAERRLVAYGLAPLLYNGGIVAGVLLLSDRYGIFSAAIGAVGGALAHLAIRVVGLRGSAFRPLPRLRLRGPGIGAFVRLMLPQMASHPIEPLTFLYFTAVASRFDVGSVSSLAFARSFASVPVSLVGASFAIAAFPVLSAAAGARDRTAFRRTTIRTLASIVALTAGAAVVLFLGGRLLIGTFLGGGAFDQADIDRTTMILGLFTLAIPLESATHLLTRALFATRNTVLATIASLVGFAVLVLTTELAAPALGLAAIPLAFAAGMATKVALLCVALVPRIRGIGRPAPRPDPESPRASARARRRRAVGAIAGAVAVIALSAGAIQATSAALSGVNLAVVPEVTPWARVDPPASPSVPPIGTSPPSVGPTATSSAGHTPRPTLGATPAPTPGPFAMDLYKKGDYVGELRDIWCVPAAMQVSMNIMNSGSDTSTKTQQKLFDFTRSLAPAPDGGSEPAGWAEGLTQLGYGNYQVALEPSIRAAVQLAARQVRLTNRPAGFMVWHGAHSWVMSGFTASADPALTDKFTVTAVRIEDVWYPRISKIWGPSFPPDSLDPVSSLSIDYFPWKRPQAAYPGMDGKYVLIIPVR